MEATQNKKTTLATIKAFVRRNASGLYVRTTSSFDGMTDCVQSVKGEFRKVESLEASHKSNTLGIQGAWFVGGSRDYFDAYDENGFKGYRVYNSCGSFILAVKSTVDIPAEPEPEHDGTASEAVQLASVLTKQLQFGRGNVISISGPLFEGPGLFD